jgi:acetoin utilization deacetylase AcuC-like enzyme
MKLTFDGLAQRDTMVLEAAHQRRIPVAIAMAGGYGREMDDTIRVHLQTIAIGAQYAARWPLPPARLAAAQP